MSPSNISNHKTVGTIRKNVVGARCQYSTPFGKREMVYADYTASGRCLKFLEEYMLDVVAPLYANTHTEASMTGAQTTRLREEARDIIGQSVNAPKKEYVVLFTGTGSTGAIDKLFRVLGLDLSVNSEKFQLAQIPENKRPVVFISHLEHHSNELIWRHSLARCIVINEDANGAPDLKHLEQELRRFKRQRVPLIGSFSAGSNVTGMQTPVRAITKLLHRHGAYAFFDYAGVGAYVDIDMQGNGADEAMDAIFLSPHKFVGGPGSAGVLVARRSLLERPFGSLADRPTVPGGGTVAFVTEHDQIYANDIESREDAGTPGILQCIRAGLAFKVKEMVGSKTIHELEKVHGAIAIKAWNKSPFISLVGCDRSGYFDIDKRVSIISFNVLSPVSAKTYNKMGIHMAITKDKQRANRLPLHYNFIITLLNDLYGIQARGGCSCAGPYSARLFGLCGEESKDAMKRMEYLASKGHTSFKPGWARLNFNYFISKEEAAFMVEAVEQIAVHGWKLLPQYVQDIHSGQFFHRSNKVTCPYSLSNAFSDIALNTGSAKQAVPICKTGDRLKSSYDQVLRSAMQIYKKAARNATSSKSSNDIADFTDRVPGSINNSDIWWLRPSEAAAELADSSPRKLLWRKKTPRSHAEQHLLKDTVSSSTATSSVTDDSSLASSLSDELDSFTAVRISDRTVEIEC
mmetsp:Transcript_28461/g.43474  ORF Transcript_28461/g.43474 Transcript_28461/m.43474 type:complete len:688 (-) Transcript_28461:114-2177(-)